MTQLIECNNLSDVRRLATERWQAKHADCQGFTTQSGYERYLLSQAGEVASRTSADDPGALHTLNSIVCQTRSASLCSTQRAVEIAEYALSQHPSLKKRFGGVAALLSFVGEENGRVFSGIPAERMSTNVMRCCGNSPVTFAAGANVAGRGRRFSGVAYDAPVSWGGQPHILETQNVELWSSRLPLLLQHDHVRPVGIVESINGDNDKLTVSGSLHDNGDGRAIAKLLADGHPFQMSVGVSLENTEPVPIGETRNCGNMRVHGPCVVVRKPLLSEISIVSVGASKGTSVGLV